MKESGPFEKASRNENASIRAIWSNANVLFIASFASFVIIPIFSMLCLVVLLLTHAYRAVFFMDTNKGY